LLCFSSLSSLFPSLFSSLFPSSLPSLFHSATPFSFSLFILLYTKKSIPYTIPAPIPTDLQFASLSLLIHNLTYVHFLFYFKHQKNPFTSKKVNGFYNHMLLHSMYALYIKFTFNFCYLLCYY